MRRNNSDQKRKSPSPGRAFSHCGYKREGGTLVDDVVLERLWQARVLQWNDRVLREEVRYRPNEEAAEHEERAELVPRDLPCLHEVRVNHPVNVDVLHDQDQDSHCR